MRMRVGVCEGADLPSNLRVGRPLAPLHRRKPTTVPSTDHLLQHLLRRQARAGSNRPTATSAPGPIHICAQDQPTAAPGSAPGCCAVALLPVWQQQAHLRDVVVLGHAAHDVRDNVLLRMTMSRTVHVVCPRCLLSRRNGTMCAFKKLMPHSASGKIACCTMPVAVARRM